jgi:hypothetical protein
MAIDLSSDAHSRLAGQETSWLSFSVLFTMSPQDPDLSKSNPLSISTVTSYRSTRVRLQVVPAVTLSTQVSGDATLRVTLLYGYSPVRPPSQQPSRNTLNRKLRSADCCCHLLIRTALKLAACLGANRVAKTHTSYQKHKSISLPLSPSSGRHLSYVQLITSLKSNLCTVLTTLKTTKIINSHIQDTTALQPNVF